MDPGTSRYRPWQRYVNLDTIRVPVAHNRCSKTGKVVFFVLRQCTSTAQVICAANDDIPKEMVKYISKYVFAQLFFLFICRLIKPTSSRIPCESVVDIYGTVVEAPAPIVSVTQQDIEIQALKVLVVSAAAAVLPMQIADASRPCPEDSETGQTEQDGAIVSRPVRLDNRWLDLRTTANHAIFRLQSAVGRYANDQIPMRHN